MNSSLRIFSGWLASIYRFSQRNAALTVCSILLIAFSAAFGLPKQRHLISYRDLFDEKFESARRFDETQDLFSTGNAVLLLAKPKQGAWTNRLLCDYQNWIVDEKGKEEVDSANSVFNLRETENTPYSLHYPWIIPLDCQNPLGPVPNFSKIENSFWNGTLYSSKTNDLGVTFIFRDTPNGSKYGKFDPRPIGETIERFNHTLGDRLEGVWTGPAMYDYSIRNSMSRMRMLNLAVLLLILFLYRAFLGTWRSGFLMAGTLMVTGLTLYGTMGFCGVPLDILSSGLFIMITVAAHQDFSYLSSLRSKSKNTSLLFRRFLVPSFFTSLTTFVGFASLCVSEISMIARFGLCAAIGAMLEWVMIFLFLPAFLKLFPKLQNWVNPEKVWIQNPLKSNFWKKITPSFKMSRVLLLFFFAIPVALHFANFSDDPKGIFESSHPFRQALAYVLKTRGWDGDLNIVFSPGQTKEFKQKIIEKYSHDPLVAKVESSLEISDYFAKGLNELDASTVKRDLLVSGMLTPYEAKHGQSRAIFYINTTDQQTVLAFKKKIDADCPHGECYVTGPIDLYTEFIYQVSKTLTESLILSLIFVILIMVYLIRARGIPHGAALITSSLWGPAMMVILIAISQISINAFTCNFASVLVGLAGDNAIQFMFAFRKRNLSESVHARGEGAFFTSFVMSMCSLTFLGAIYHPPKVMGVLLCIGFMLNFYGDYGILSGLIGKPSGPKTPA